MPNSHKGQKRKKTPTTRLPISGDMAGECTETTPVATTSSIHNWWPDLHACSLSSWSTTNNTWNSELNNNSESSAEESATSFTNASDRSGLSVESSRRILVDNASVHELIGETVSDHHLWNQVFLNVGNNGDLHNSQDFGENLLDGLPSKNISTEMFDPTCDYTRKMDNSLLLSSMGSFNTEKQLNMLNNSMMESQPVPKLSDLVGNWSNIPTQDGQINHQFEPPRSDLIALNSMMKDPFSDLGQGKQSLDRNFGSDSCFGHDVKMEDEFGRSFDNYRVGNHKALGNTILGVKSRKSYGLPNIPCTNSRNFGEVLPSVSHLSRPLVDINSSKPILKTLDLSGFGKQVFQTFPFPSPKSTSSTMARSNRRSQGLVNGGKKRQRTENSHSALKKPKQEANTVTSTKLQVPKAKLAEKIAALQQIVSPFGKTDTASVLWEAIAHIRFLQEQIQLLSNPYMKGNGSKDLWGGLDRKDRGDGKLDLKSRGLCLVPISCTPQVYHENAGSDYLTPMYRGCLYR